MDSLLKHMERVQDPRCSRKKKHVAAEMTKIKTAMEENLSDEDLAKSAGGADAGKIALTVSVVSSTVVTMFSSAAAASV